MKSNIGTTDKVIRILIDVVIGILYFTNIISGTLAIVLGILAVVFLLTSFISFCPLYRPFNINTLKKQKTMKNYMKNWDFMRVLRLALGIFVIVQGVQTKEWMFVAIGGIFSLMPLLNIGCCGISGCTPPVRKSNGNTEDITYEEIK